MAFSSTIQQRGIAVGNRRMAFGTFSCASVAGGDVDTGLRKVEHISLTVVGSAVASTASVVNETLPCAGNAVTIVTPSSAAGNWIAWGY